MPLHFLRFSCLLVACLSGCLAPVHIRAARTLDKGEHEAGVSFAGANAMRGAVEWYNGTNDLTKKAASSQAIVSGAPELAYHYGILEGVEAGVRLGGGAGLVEVDGTYRFAKVSLFGGTLHAATGLAFGTALPKDVAGSRVTLPVKATWDINDSWGVTLGGHAGWRWVGQDPHDPHSLPDKIDELRWTLGSDGLTYGGGLAGDWRTDEWIVRVFSEVNVWQGEIGADKKLSLYDVLVVQGGLAVGYKWGKDATATRKAKDDLDAMTAPK